MSNWGYKVKHTKHTPAFIKHTDLTMYAFHLESQHHSPHHHHHHHHNHNGKHSPKSQESDDEENQEITSGGNIGPPTRISSCNHSSASCVTVPTTSHIPEDIDLPSCIYANRSLTGVASHHHHHHHHHISEHMPDDCIHDGTNVLTLNEDVYYNGDNCSPYRVQRQAANIRERKRMLRSESRTRNNSDKPPIKM